MGLRGMHEEQKGVVAKEDALEGKIAIFGERDGKGENN